MSVRRKAKQGRVLSDKMQKTVVVEVESLRRHRLYGKVIRTRKRYKAHCEQDECKVGDQVEITESRPLSRDKRWKVVRVLRRLEG
jgi:small subunit ribosomal protein S17